MLVHSRKAPREGQSLLKPPTRSLKDETVFIHGIIMSVHRKPNRANCLCLVVYLVVSSMVLPVMGLCTEPDGSQINEMNVFCDSGSSFPGAVGHCRLGSFCNPCPNLDKEAQGLCVAIPFSTIALDRRSLSPSLDSARLSTSFLALSLANQTSPKKPFHFGHFSSGSHHESLRSTVLLI